MSMCNRILNVNEMYKALTEIEFSLLKLLSFKL